MKKPIQKLFQLVAITLLVSACAHTPMGPTVSAMPPEGKPFGQFAQEDDYCRRYAENRVSGQAENANLRGAGEALIGTGLGAGLGAVFGGGHGALVGGAIGATGGTLYGAGTSSREQGGIQHQFNNAYVQCMAGYGNEVPYPSQRQPRQQTTIIYQQPQPVLVPVYREPRYYRYHR